MKQIQKSTRLPRREFLVFGAPAIDEAEIADVVACLRGGWIGTGPRVTQFEEAFAAYKGVRSAVAVSSCTSALHLSMLAAGLGPGDEVITSALTFCATVNAIIHAGATPVIADVDPATMNLDPVSAAAHVTSHTRAIVPVHFAGRPCDMDALLDIARRNGLAVIEDAAHAVEAEYHGAKTGTMGDYGCFSFYVTKNIITGEGGMVVPRDEEGAARIKVLALHGMSADAWRRFSDEGYRHYAVVEAGFKCNMTDLEAALGLRQLARVEANWLRRHEIWQRYDEAFADLPVTAPAPTEAGVRHGHHLYTILIDEARTGIARDAFLDGMTAQGIGVGVHYLSLPEHPYYREKFGWRAEDVPAAALIGRQTVSLPLSPALSDDDVDDVIAAVEKVLDLA